MGLTGQPRRAVRRRVGILGGTFDPVHVGHIALGRAACVALSLDELRLVPTGLPWQKDRVATPAEDRVAMLRLAVAREPGWIVDTREVERDGPSYTIDTLESLRAELGPECALVMIIGSDQLRNLATWHRWRELLDHAHIAATRRERVSLEDLPEPVEALVAAHGADALPDAPAGSVVFFSMPPVPVSSTLLRSQLAAGTAPAELLPAGVLEHIESRRLYRDAPPPK
jgi:nicotinate-nucleotide adenylyltransferase